MPLFFTGCSQESDSIALSVPPARPRTSFKTDQRAQAPPPGRVAAVEVGILPKDAPPPASARADALAEVSTETSREEIKSRGEQPSRPPVQPTPRAMAREPRRSEFTPYWSAPGVEGRFRTRPNRRSAPTDGRRKIMRGLENTREIASDTAAPDSRRRRVTGRRGPARYRKRGAGSKQPSRKQARGKRIANNRRRPSVSNRPARPKLRKTPNRRTHKRQPKGFHLIKPYLAGMASWYGPGFHGRPTANGERYNQNGITAAHPVLPMGTWIRVTNQENGKVLSMRVNDRGPYAKGRILDLSKGAAIRLGMYKKGTARVRIEVLRWPASVRKDVGLRPFVQYVVQVAAFPDPKLAWRELKRLRRIHRWAAFSLDRRPGGLMGIVAGPFDDKRRALDIARRLKKSGARPLVRRYRK